MMANFSGGKWGQSNTPGTPANVVTWSIASAGLDLTGFGFGLNGQASRELSSFLNFDFQSGLRSAFSAWSAISNIEFLQVQDEGGSTNAGVTADIRIFGGSIAGQVKGVGFFPNTAPNASGKAGNIVIDSNGNIDPIFFGNLALHEIGHAIGLDHVVNVSAIMNPIITVNGLQNDDIVGAQTIYGTQDFGSSVYIMRDQVFSNVSGQENLTILGVIPGLTVQGNTLNNVINGTVASETFFGNGGDDTLNGAGGNDSLQGGDGNDIMDGGAGNDVLLAGAGNDTLTGGTGNNILNGGTGNDIFIAGAGADDFRGSTGFDTVDYSSVATGAITINLFTGLSIGFGANGDTFTGIEKIIGTDRRDFLGGDIGANELEGGAGNDTVTGRLGDDIVSGGIGNDNVFGGVGADIVNGNDGIDALQGGDGNDTMDGGSGNDTLFAGAGNDTLIGGSGNDRMLGGAGNDTFVGGEGADEHVGGTGFDTVDYSSVTIGAVSINLFTGLSIGFGANGDTFTDIEKIIGTDRRDFLAGDFGINNLDGGAGNDTVTGRLGDDIVSGGAGNDSVFGGVGNDIVNGNDGFDALQGGDGDDTMDGGSGNDTLFAGAGNDTLIGGSGNDRMLGGTGTDSFVFKTNFGNDTITDFTTGIASDDVIELDSALGLSNLAGVLAVTTQVGADSIITVDANNSITLTGVNLSTLHEDDFRFV